MSEATPDANPAALLYQSQVHQSQGRCWNRSRVVPDLEGIVAGFTVGSILGPIVPLGQGLINATFAVDTSTGPYVLQRVNRLVFPAPEQIMDNLAVLAAHTEGRDGLRVPALIPAQDGRPFLRTPDGELWRLMELIPDAVSLARLETPEQARQVGLALGRFHRLTSDLAPDRLGLTLPGFHRTSDYLSRQLALRTEVDPSAFDPAVSACIAFIDARRGLELVLEDALAAGLIHLRVTHGDPKIDNILFHATEGHALALIDLDTVQPGLIQHDLGDCLRSCCNRRGESATGGRVQFDLAFCDPILSAYAEETRGFLSPEDVALLYDSIRLMPFELGLRFLNDHLEGDRYFRVTHRGQNLHKATVQFALVADIEAQESEIRRLISRVYRCPA